MTKPPRSRGLRALAAAVLVTAASGPAHADDDAPELWWRTQVNAQQLLDEQDLGELVRLAGTAPPSSAPAELLRRLDLFLRAGHRADASEILARLARPDAALPNGVLNDVAMTLLDREEWELAARLFELAPRTEAGWTYVLLGHWKRSGRSVAEIDAWLQARQAANPTYWIKVRGSFLAEEGASERLVRELADAVRARPADADAVKLYLEVAGEREPLSWLASTYRPGRAWHAFEIATLVLGRAPDVAVALLERALELPFTEDDLHDALRHRQALLTPEQARASSIAGIKHWLVRAYQRNAQPDEAQKLLQTLVEDPSADGPLEPWLAGLAGQVQAASGARVVEERIRNQEAENPDSPSYWLGRAEYYAGRREATAAEEAYRKALALAPGAPDAPKPKGMDTERTRILASYSTFLLRAGRAQEAAALLRRELEQTSPEDWLASWVVSRLLDLDPAHGVPIDANDPQLWRHLEGRAVWNGNERQLLDRLLERAGKEGRPALITRAEALASREHPSRAATLGWLLTRTNESRRAVPLLLDAAARLTDETAVRQALFALFEAYLELGDWRAAERIFPAARQQLTPAEQTTWQPRIAVLAARDGAHGDALRIWKAAANHDWTAIRLLDELAAAGMREPLRGFYEEIAGKDPESWAPSAALARLR